MDFLHALRILKQILAVSGYYILGLWELGTWVGLYCD